VAGAACSVGAQEAASSVVETNPPPKWDASASLGFSLTSGNSDTLLLTGSLIGDRKFDDANLELGLNGAYGENDGDRNVQSLRGWGQYDDLFSQRTYWYGRVEGLHDGIADIEYRFTLGPGVGYYFLKKERTFLRGETGPAFIYERKGNVNSGYFALRFAERFEHQFNERVKLYQSFEFLPQIDDWGDYLVNCELGVESALSEKMSLNVFLLDNYVSRPAPDRENNDIKLVTALKYKF
jgi:putative salt-induced outer membrane protein